MEKTFSTMCRALFQFRIKIDATFIRNWNYKSFAIFPVFFAVLFCPNSRRHSLPSRRAKGLIGSVSTVSQKILRRESINQGNCLFAIHCCTLRNNRAEYLWDAAPVVHGRQKPACSWLPPLAPDAADELYGLDKYRIVMNFLKMKTKQASKIFEALSSDVRLDLFRLLVKNAPEGLVQGDIARQLDIPSTNLSFHLKTIVQSGLVDVEREGRFMRYKANIALMFDIISYLTSECCSNHPEECQKFRGTNSILPDFSPKNDP